MSNATLSDWIIALRSGEFKQCSSALTDNIGGNCCMGVAAIIRKGTYDRIEDEFFVDNAYYDNRSTPSYWLVEPFGLPEIVIVDEDEAVESHDFYKVGQSVDMTEWLAYLNDTRGYIFDDIAHYLERFVDGNS